MKLKQGLIVSAVAACALLVGVLPATAQTTTRCTGEVSGQIRANVVVPANEICDVIDATITGNVTVGRGADIYVDSSTVNGNVIAQRDSYIEVFDSALNGSVRLNAAYGLYMWLSGAASTVTGNFTNSVDENGAPSGFMYVADSDMRSDVSVMGGEAIFGDDLVGDETPAPDAEGRGSRITGDLATTDTLLTDVFNTVLYSDVSVSGAELGLLMCTSEIDGQTSITGNSELVQVGGDTPVNGCGFNVMSGDVDISDNTGDTQIAGNVIRGNLDCEGNDPAPTIGANRLRGVGTGQCDPASEIAAAQPTAAARINSDSSAASAMRHATAEARILERRAEAGVEEPTVEEKEEAAENQVETRAADAEAAPAAPPARVEGRALPPRGRG